MWELASDVSNIFANMSSGTINWWIYAGDTNRKDDVQLGSFPRPKSQLAMYSALHTLWGKFRAHARTRRWATSGFYK